MVKRWEGREEGTFVDFCFTGCPGSVGPPGAREVQAALEQSEVLDHLRLATLEQSRMQRGLGWLEIPLEASRAGPLGTVLEQSLVDWKSSGMD